MLVSEMLNECTISLGAMHRGVEGTEDGLLHFMFLSCPYNIRLINQ